MDKRYKITALCGMGLGTSSIARMAIMDYVKQHGINAQVDVSDIGSIKGLNSDIILTTKSMSSHISDEIKSKIAVLYVSNLINKKEINSTLDNYFSDK
jgi:PTS system ascorbate-specific IIB component